jgi:predicted dehydrogenase
MRRDPDKARDYASRHAIAHSCSNIEDFYETSTQYDVNSVYIATPPSSHKDYVIAALSKGYNVYIEKPIALNCSEARAIQETLKESPGSKLSVAHYRRQLPLFLHLKRLLDTQSIGTVRSCNLRCWKSTKKEEYTNPENWRLNAAVSGGGYFHDLAPHQLDILIHLFGYPLSSQGLAAAPPEDSITPTNTSTTATTTAKVKVSVANDHVYGLSLFPNNVVFNGSWCFAVPEKDALDECVIVGTAGSIVFSFFGASSAVRMTMITSEGITSNEEWQFEHPKHIQGPMISKVISYFLNSEEDTEEGNGDGGGDTSSSSTPACQNPCSIQDAIAVMQMMDAYVT